jgi:ribosomal protein S18 acetylase RimI-like enzyme
VSSSIRFRLDSATATQIAEHLERCDDTFVPPLSSRIGIKGYAHKIRRHAVRFEAWDNESLVGLVAAYLNADRRVAFITNVSVEAGFRRTGIASELIERCIERVTKQGFDGIELEVDSTNAAAIDLYLGRGFAVGGMPGNSVMMRLQTGRG